MTVTIKNTKAEIFAELEALRTKYNDLAAARQGTSRQDHSAQRWETMQKAKALAMSSGRSVKC